MALPRGASTGGYSMLVLLLNGSPNKNGHTAKALATVEKELNVHDVDTTWFQLGTKMVRGCIGCNNCAETFRCAFTDDKCNELIDAITQADAVVVGSPVYFAGPNGALCALLDRVFYAACAHKRLFRGKPAAAVTTCWRAGGVAAIDRLNKYFLYSEMPVVSSKYWNMNFMDSDGFGSDVLRQLAVNMSEMLKSLK